MNRREKIVKIDLEKKGFGEVTKCPYCSFEWEPRVLKPKSCPRCRRYLPWKKMTPREWAVRR